MAFGGFKLGQYRHFKKGAPYIAYDITKDEGTQKETVSYIRLSDSSKHSRPIEEFQEDVSEHPENETGQKHRYKLMDTSTVFVINNRTKTPTEPAVIEDGKIVKQEVLGEAFETMKEFLEANGIPLPIKLGDTVTIPNPLVNDLSHTESFEVSGINDAGLYVITIRTKTGAAHGFVPWSKLFSVTLSFK